MRPYTESRSPNAATGFCFVRIPITAAIPLSLSAARSPWTCVLTKKGSSTRDDLSEDSSRFLPVTDARVYRAADESLLYHSSLLLVSYQHIIMISPLEALADVRPVPWQPAAEQEDL